MYYLKLNNNVCVCMRASVYVCKGPIKCYIVQSGWRCIGISADEPYKGNGPTLLVSYEVQTYRKGC